jgi:hypothetical protein
MVKFDEIRDVLVPFEGQRDGSVMNYAMETLDGGQESSDRYFTCGRGPGGVGR